MGREQEMGICKKSANGSEDIGAGIRSVNWWSGCQGTGGIRISEGENWKESMRI